LICNVALQRCVSTVNVRADAVHPRERGSLTPTVKVLECDPELGLRVPPEQIHWARDALLAPALALEAGPWEPPIGPDERRGLGYLVLDGVLARDVVLAGNTSTELLGEGDVIQPTAGVSDDRLVRCHVGWRVLETVRLAVLGESFARRLGEWPQVQAALFERAVRRSLHVSIHQALLQLSPVETRLLVVFWFLAERWGRVTPDGIVLRLRLSHQLLGQLVGCQRASVTTALRRVIDSGMVVRRSDATWLLRGSPPDELTRLNWPQRIAAGTRRGRGGQVAAHRVARA
jgi:CRP-like cAMP-binding protein